MSKKKDKPLLFNYKIRLFMYYHYILQKPSGEAYLLAGFNANSPESANSAGFELKQRLDSHEELSEIVRQLNPFPDLVGRMINLEKEAKDPNLRFKIQSKLGLWSGAERDMDGSALAGIAINIIAGKAQLQVNAGDGPGEADSPEKTQIKKDGKPQSFIK
jgi:hypothetical protein